MAPDPLTVVIAFLLGYVLLTLWFRRILGIRREKSRATDRSARFRSDLEDGNGRVPSPPTSAAPQPDEESAGDRRPCPHCGHPNPAGFVYCGNCVAKIGDRDSKYHM